MSDEYQQLTDMANRLFGEAVLPADEAAWPVDLWNQIEQLGLLDLLSVSEKKGLWCGWDHAYAVLRLSGYHGIGLPLGEGIIAAKLLADVGLQRALGPLGLVCLADASFDGNLLSGMAHGVPWGRHLETLVVVFETGDGTRLASVPRFSAKVVREGANVAGEPRDDIAFANVAVDAHCTGLYLSDLFQFGALIRAAQISGALMGALDLSVQYAKDRSQFGSPIGGFQAIQQQLAVLASEAAAVGCAASVACQKASSGIASFEIAAAKLRANISIGIGGAIAHQVHGAMGFTREYPLHRLTRRLWSWRSEFGNDAHWSERLGALALDNGHAAFWPNLVNTENVNCNREARKFLAARVLT